jgi:hypothetical protein
VIEARRPEAVTKVLLEAFVLSEDNAGEHRSPFTGRDALERIRDLAAETIGDSADSSPAPHDAVAGRAQDDVDSLAAEILGLVEPALLVRRTRLRDCDDGLEDRALRR